jgi:hypothetical protein
MKRVIVLSMILGLVMGTAAFAMVPEKISYQGILTNASGGIVPNGNYDLTLSLYDTLSGGTALWTEAQQVMVTNGIFNVMLGSVVPIHIAFDKPLYLGVAVAGGSELTPRTMLSASPYSLDTPRMAFVSSGNTTTIGTSWTNYEDDSVGIYCPGPGYVIARSTTWLQINHTQGTEDGVYVVHDTTATDMGPSWDYVSAYGIAANDPTYYKDVTIPVQTVFVIPAAGYYTFYLNAEMTSGQDTQDHFWYASTTVEWHPASDAALTLAAQRHSSASRQMKIKPSLPGVK